MRTTVPTGPTTFGETLADADETLVNPEYLRTRANTTVAQAIEIQEREAVRLSVEAQFPTVAAFLQELARENPESHASEEILSTVFASGDPQGAAAQILRRIEAERVGEAEAGCEGLAGACVADHTDPLSSPDDFHCQGAAVAMPAAYGDDFPEAHLCQWAGDVPRVCIGQDTPELDLAGVDQLLTDLHRYTARIAGLRAQLARLQGGHR